MKTLRVLLACAVLACHPLYAKPIAVSADGLVLLTDEPCALQEVTNLPGKALWTENGKTTEGCYGVKFGVVISYWSVDKTVALIPLSVFRKVTDL